MTSEQETDPSPLTVPFGLRCFLLKGQFDQISTNIKLMRNNQLTVASAGLEYVLESTSG